MRNVAVISRIRGTLGECFRFFLAEKVCTEHPVAAAAWLRLHKLVEGRHDFLFKPPTGVVNPSISNSPSRLRSAADNFLTAFTSRTLRRFYFVDGERESSRGLPRGSPPETQVSHFDFPFDSCFKAGFPFPGAS
jgi:hypothetical protein